MDRPQLLAQGSDPDSTAGFLDTSSWFQPVLVRVKHSPLLDVRLQKLQLCLMSHLRFSDSQPGHPKTAMVLMSTCRQLFVKMSSYLSLSLPISHVEFVTVEFDPSRNALQATTHMNLAALILVYTHKDTPT